jgi:hypothetical protein
MVMRQVSAFGPVIPSPHRIQADIRPPAIAPVCLNPGLPRIPPTESTNGVLIFIVS